MTYPSFNVDCVSADVRLRLVVGSRSYPLAQMGPHDVILRTAMDLPPGQVAELEMVVEGRLRRWQVVLPFGASEGDPDVFTERIMT